MKRRVKTSHLRQARKFPGKKLNSTDRRRHVIGIERQELLDIRHEFRSDPLGPAVPRAAVNEPVADRGEMSKKTVFAEPRENCVQRLSRDSVVNRSVQERRSGS